MENEPLNTNTQFSAIESESTEYVSRLRRSLALLQDPDCRAAIAALYRTGMNTVIGAVDMFSFPGESMAWIPEGIKIGRAICRRVGIDPKFLDLTPDVSLWVTIPTELVEIPTATHAPSHWIEGSLQFWQYDRLRIVRGRESFRVIKSIATLNELRAYQESKQPKIVIPPLSDLSAQEILELVPKPII